VQGHLDSVDLEDLMASVLGSKGKYPQKTYFECLWEQMDSVEALLVYFELNIAFNAGPQFRRRQTHARQQQAEPAGNFAAFMQLLPVLLLFLLSFISMWTSEEESFSFRRTYEYSLEVKSVPHSVPYYVNPKTYKRRYNTKKKQAELDRNVEAEVIYHLY
jgi:hypothetical protein